MPLTATMADSPRRSPRISARTSLEAQRDTTPTPSPLAVRSQGRRNQQLQSRSPSTPLRKPRASTSTLMRGPETADRSSPTKGGILTRRAYSVGGAIKPHKPAHLSVPSRRNVPGPRKSAIRALPPQVFASPSELSPPPSIRPLFSRKSLGLEAFGGTELMNLMESIGIIKSQRDTEHATTQKEMMPRKSEPVASTSEDCLDDDVTLARKRRRVTFNPYQEKANFEKDEPTMRIRPGSGTEVLHESSTSEASTSTSTESASGSSDMSLDTESSSEGSEDSESEAEVEGQTNAALYGNEEQEEEADSHDGESAMDLTAAYGGMQDATMSGIAHGFSNDDDSASDSGSESQADTVSVLDDVTATMQLTELHGGDLNTTRRTNATGMDDAHPDDLLVLEEEKDEDTVERQLEEKRKSQAKEEGLEVEDMDMELDTTGSDSIEEVRVDQSEANSSAMSLTKISEVPPSPRSPPTHPHPSPLQPRYAPNTRSRSRSRSPSPKQLRAHLEHNQSPRLGHEHCKMPAADSPKPRVSTTTLRMQARRRSSQSPIKSSAAPYRVSIGYRPSSPEKMPFRASSSPRKSLRSGAPISSSDGPSQHSQTQSAIHDDQAQPASSPRSPRQQRPPSPLRSPGSPSRTWQNFRDSQRAPSTPKSPARRVSVCNKDGSTGLTSTFGSPQRIALPTASREAGRSLHVANTPARQAQSSALSVTSTQKGNDGSGWTMKQFFDMLDMGFLDLTIPVKRRIEFPAGDVVEMVSTAAMMRAACSTVPAIDGLVDACKELKASVDEGRIMLADSEREFYENPPSYVGEVLAMATSLERQKAVSSFKIQKSAARAIALKAYYGWRTDKQFDDAVLLQLDKTRESLAGDLADLRRTARTVASSSLPMLRDRCVILTDELKRTRKRQEEIDEWDTEEMRAMHTAMLEQSAVLEEQRATHAETREQLTRLKARLEELDQRKDAAQEAITQARASSDAIRGSTRAEAARLAQHVEQLATLHMWSLRSASAKEICMVLNQELTLSMHLDQTTRSGHVKAVSLQLNLASDLIRTVVCDALHTSLNRHLKENGQGPMDIVRTVTSVWARARHMVDLHARMDAHHPVKLYSTSSCNTSSEASLMRTIVSILDLHRPLYTPEQIECERIYGHPGAATALSARICDAMLAGRSPNIHGADLAGVIRTSIAAMNQ